MGDDGREEEFDYGEEPNFEDPEDFVDDITDEELMPEIMKMQPKESDGVDSVIVIDNVPQVEGARVEKLKNVIRKIYSKFGKLMNEHYPVDDEGKTKGYIFLEFNNHANALEAVKQTNNYKLDKAHTFQVNLFSDFEKYEAIPEVWDDFHQISKFAHPGVQYIEFSPCEKYLVTFSPSAPTSRATSPPRSSCGTAGPG